MVSPESEQSVVCPPSASQRLLHVYCPERQDTAATGTSHHIQDGLESLGHAKKRFRIMTYSWGDFRGAFEALRNPPDVSDGTPTIQP